MNLLCIDPGLCHTGWIIVDALSGSLVADGCINTEKAKAKNMRVANDTIDRTQMILRELMAQMKAHQISGILAELPSGGGQSAVANKSMGIATAVCAALAEYSGKPAEWYSPMDVKKALAGLRNASKEDMERKAVEIFPELRTRWSSSRATSGFEGTFEHVADAVGVWVAARNGTLVRLIRETSSMGGVSL
jgi:Holliday junction resolvasome RuvABC endonuclease subunit